MKRGAGSAYPRADTYVHIRLREKSENEEANANQERVHVVEEQSDGSQFRAFVCVTHVSWERGQKTLVHVVAQVGVDSIPLCLIYHLGIKCC